MPRDMSCWPPTIGRSRCRSPVPSRSRSGAGTTGSRSASAIGAWRSLTARRSATSRWGPWMGVAGLRTTARSTTRPNCGASWWRWGLSSAPPPIPKWCWRLTGSGGGPAWPASTACSPSRCGTGGSASSSARGTDSGSSRSTTAKTAGGFCSRPRSRRCAATPRTRPDPMTAPCTTTSRRRGRTTARRRSTRASASSPPARASPCGSAGPRGTPRTSWWRGSSGTGCRTRRGRPPRTFSACHADPRFDERPFIQAVVAATGAVNQEIFPDAVRLFDELPRVRRHQEEPFAGTSVLAQWCVMRAAGQAGVKVLLDGQGADELLLGYPGYLGSRLADLARSGRWVEGLREWQAWRRLHGPLPPTAQANFVRGLFPEGQVRWLRSRATDESAWLDRDFAAEACRKADAATDLPHSRSAVAAHSLRSITQGLPALLHYEDRNAMAFSVEARVPFLDHRLVEWLARLPPELKLHRGMTKVVLREAMDGILPKEVRRRTDKMGFVTPEDQWLRVTWRSHIEAMLDSTSCKSRPYWRARVLKEWSCSGPTRSRSAPCRS